MLLLAAPRTPHYIACAKRKLLNAELSWEVVHQRDCDRFWLAEVPLGKLGPDPNLVELCVAISTSTKHDLMALPYNFRHSAAMPDLEHYSETFVRNVVFNPTMIQHVIHFLKESGSAVAIYPRTSNTVSVFLNDTKGWTWALFQELLERANNKTA